MKGLYSLCLIAISFITSQALAFTSNQGNNINITVPINDDYYVAGEQIMVDSAIMGDVHAFGSTINIGGNIDQDCVILGNEVIIRSQIGDDCRIFANTVKIFNTIKGDLIIAANRVEIANNIEINGDAIITADTLVMNGKIYGKAMFNTSELILNGQIMGNTFINSKSYVLGTNAKINGTLNYTSDSKIIALEELTNSPIVREETTKNTNIIDGIHRFLKTAAVRSILFLTICGGILYFVFESTWLQVANILRQHTGKSFLTGLIVYAILPLIIVIASMTVIGIPFAILLGVLYGFLVLFYELLIVIIFTALATQQWFSNKSTKHTFAKVCIIITLAGLSTFIIALDSIAGCFALGSMTLLLLQHFKFLKLK